MATCQSSPTTFGRQNRRFSPGAAANRGATCRRVRWQKNSRGDDTALSGYLATWSPGLPDSFIRFFVSLLFRSNFAITRKKFPVLLRRKACAKPSKCAVLGAHSPPAGSAIDEIPCKYPVYQGIAFRDGFAADCVHSHTVPSLTKSRPDSAEKPAIRGLFASTRNQRLGQFRVFAARLPNFL